MYQQNLSAALQALHLETADLTALIEQKKESLKRFETQLRQENFPAFTICNTVENIDALQNIADGWKNAYETVVFLGVGGSSLGAQTLVNFMGRFKKHNPEIILMDNVDPSSMENLLTGLNLATTGVVAVSKSGGTLETLAQTALFIQAFEAANIDVTKHIIGLSEETNNPLRNYLVHRHIPMLNHPMDVGGRFTLFTLVSLLPALLAGLNAEELRRGGADILTEFLENPEKHPASQAAALSVLAAEKNVPMQVFMPYSDRLKTLSNWFVQLWAESLGKDGQGTTPIPAVGSTDQHSFLQLMMEGPNDKLISILYTDAEANERTISSDEATKIGQPVLNGLSLGKLLFNQAQGTADALISAGRPVRLFKLEKLNEYTLGG